MSEVVKIRTPGTYAFLEAIANSSNSCQIGDIVAASKNQLAVRVTLIDKGLYEDGAIVDLQLKTQAGVQLSGKFRVIRVRHELLWWIYVLEVCDVCFCGDREKDNISFRLESVPHNDKLVDPNFKKALIQIKADLESVLMDMKNGMPKLFEKVVVTQADIMALVKEVSSEELGTKRTLLSFATEFFGALNPFEEHASRVPFDAIAQMFNVPLQDVIAEHARLAQEVLHPYLMGSPVMSQIYFAEFNRESKFFVNELLVKPNQFLVGYNPFYMCVSGWILSSFLSRDYKELMQEIHHRVKREVQLSSSERDSKLSVLDIGCSPYVAQLINDRELKDEIALTVLDCFEDSLQEMQNRVNGGFLSPVFVCKDKKLIQTRASGNNGRRYDVVICSDWGSYLSIEEVKSFLKTLVTCLKPGGLLLWGNITPNNPGRYVLSLLADLKFEEKTLGQVNKIGESFGVGYETFACSCRVIALQEIRA